MLIIVKEFTKNKVTISHFLSVYNDDIHKAIRLESKPFHPQLIMNELFTKHSIIEL